VRQKAAAVAASATHAAKSAKSAVTTAAKSEATKVASKAVVRTAKVVVEETAKSAVANAAKARTGAGRGSERSSPALVEPVSPSTQKRKIRSDAGSKRTPMKTRTAVGAPGAMEVPTLATEDAKLLTQDTFAASPAIPQALMNVAEEPSSEATPSLLEQEGKSE
jgi:hypothetical protein